MQINILSTTLCSLLIVFSTSAGAHCDSMDGPVVLDAQKAIARKTVGPVLKWVAAQDEKTITEAFERTLEVREKGKVAQELADQYFFETLVRVHRASEGEGFTGLKPSGQVDPAFVATDKAIMNGDISSLANEISGAAREGILHRFEKAHKLKKTADKSAKQGREYVKAYVELTHFVEEIHELINKGASHKHQD